VTQWLLYRPRFMARLRRSVFYHYRGRQQNSSFHASRNKRILHTVIQAVGVALIVAVGLYGGELVYAFGVGMASATACALPHHAKSRLLPKRTGGFLRG
jgi:hypothetical protein